MIWGFSFVVMKDVVTVMPPAWLLGIRFTLAGFILLFILRKRVKAHFSKRALGAGLAVTLGPLNERYAFYVPYRCYEQAQQIVEDLFAVKEDAPADETDADAETDAP